ncbi:Phosphoenolpyruvate carboxylase 4 [Glycine soja]
MDSNAVFVGSFAVCIGIQTALCAEVMAAIFAIEMASSKNFIKVTLFHGRGGSIGRGGGPTYLAIQSQPPGSVIGTLGSTEQGEMVEAKIGLAQIAVRQLEIYTTAVLLATLGPAIPPREEKWRNVMEEISNISWQCSERQELGHELRSELMTAEKFVMVISGHEKLQQNNRSLRRLIENRLLFLNPLNMLQVERLKRLRRDDDNCKIRDALLITINGIPAGMKNTG